MNSPTTSEKFGFKFGQNGAHSARTMMLAELSRLLYGRPVDATVDQYREDVEVFNVLHKPTVKARTLTWRHLVDLYGLNTAIPLFRYFRRAWDSDEECRALLACQYAIARDPLLRLTKDKILSLDTGQHLPRAEMEEFLDSACPDRFSAASLKSFAQNVNGTWTSAGYLSGKTQKYRAEPELRPANIAFALFCGYLTGVSGNRLFNTEWTKLLLCRTERMLELARSASHSGLLTFKHSSEIVEVAFPDALSREEEKWLHE